MVSVFGRRADVEGPDGYVFFAADSRAPRLQAAQERRPRRRCTSARSTSRTTPSRAEDVLHTGVEAFEAALNTINVGKFNLGFCAIGMAEHCFYETVTQAENRVLFGKRVTEFGQVRRILSEAYARLLAAKLYGARAVDYVRSASREDRRYLLYTPINKMQVTMEGERIVSLLGEVISAKGFERDSYFESAKNIIGGLPKLEGTVHVNLALTLKFLPELPVRQRGARAAAGAPRRRRRRVPLRPGPDARPRARSRSPTGARSSTRSPSVAERRASSASRPRRSSRSLRTRR